PLATSFRDYHPQRNSNCRCDGLRQAGCDLQGEVRHVCKGVSSALRRNRRPNRVAALNAGQNGSAYSGQGLNERITETEVAVMHCFRKTDSNLTKLTAEKWRRKLKTIRYSFAGANTFQRRMSKTRSDLD